MDYILDNFESFKENEDARLKVTQNSNLYYINIGSSKYIAWEKIDFVSFYNENFIELEKSYYNVLDGDEILKYTEYKKINDQEESKSNFVFPLSELLRIKPCEEVLLSIRDINKIISFEEKQNNKTKIKKM